MCIVRKFSFSMNFLKPLLLTGHLIHHSEQMSGQADSWAPTSSSG